jgi:hypothetical protein
LTNVTLAGERTTLDGLGVEPVSNTKLTVELLTKPVPVIAIVAPPATGPDEGLMELAVGIVGDRVQLSIVIPEPQYTAHAPLLGALTPDG